MRSLAEDLSGYEPEKPGGLGTRCARGELQPRGCTYEVMSSSIATSSLKPANSAVLETSYELFRPEGQTYKLK